MAHGVAFADFTTAVPADAGEGQPSRTHLSGSLAGILLPLRRNGGTFTSRTVENVPKHVVVLAGVNV